VAWSVRSAELVASALIREERSYIHLAALTTARGV
jgi:hypothetical protein